MRLGLIVACAAQFLIGADGLAVAVAFLISLAARDFVTRHHPRRLLVACFAGSALALAWLARAPELYGRFRHRRGVVTHGRARHQDRVTA